MKFLLNGIETDRTLQDLYINKDLRDVEVLVDGETYKVGTCEDFDEFETDMYLQLWGWVSKEENDDEIRLYVDLEETYKHLDDTVFKSILECVNNAQVTIYFLDNEEVYRKFEDGTKVYEPILFYRSEHETLESFSHKEMLEVLIECEDIDEEVLESEEYLKLENDVERIKYLENLKK